jgi:hypothetical protein
VLAVSLGWFSSSSSEPTNVPFPIASAQITETLAKLPAPAGFHRGACAQVAGNIDTVCFRRRQSVVLNPGVIARVGAGLGITWFRPDSLLCHPTGVYRIPHLIIPQLRIIECGGPATVGHQSRRVATTATRHNMLVVVTSVVWVTAHGLVSTERPLSRTQPPIPGGSQVTVTYYGP